MSNEELEQDKKTIQMMVESSVGSVIDMIDILESVGIRHTTTDHDADLEVTILVGRCHHTNHLSTTLRNRAYDAAVELTRAGYDPMKVIKRLPEIIKMLSNNTGGNIDSIMTITPLLASLRP